jgi:hypothetical protein
MGMSMRIERSSLDQVKERFEANKRKLEGTHQQNNMDQGILSGDIVVSITSSNPVVGIFNFNKKKPPVR